MRHLIAVALLLVGCASGQTKLPQPAASAAAEAAAEVEAEAVGSFEIESTPVEFDGEVTLRGELVAPITDEAVPAAIIVHDWGVRGRDGVVGQVFGVRLGTEVPVYRAIAEGLAARGVAVLIYDRRNCVKGTQVWCEYPPSYVEGAGRLPTAQLTDVRAAMAWLSQQAGVASVSLIGHGHGAEIATIATSSAPVERLVLLQPSMSPLGDLARFQVEESIRQIDQRIEAVGDTPEADLLKQQKQTLQALLDGGDLLKLGEDGEAQLAQLHAMYNVALSSLDRDVLVIEAGVDPGDPPAESEQRHRRFGGQLVTITDLSRAMVSVGEGDDATVVSPEVVTRLSAFLRAAK